MSNNTDIAAEIALEMVDQGFTDAKFDPAGAVAILQMNLGRAGGLLEAKKIAPVAETRPVQIAPHQYCGPVVVAANIQITTCIPNFLILESFGTFGGAYGALLKTPLV